MLPWMSDSGDSRTSTSPLHYVVDDTWQPSMDGRSGFDAICGARVLPLWGAYDEALEKRPRCGECERYARDHGEGRTGTPARPVTILAAGIGTHVTWRWLSDVNGERIHWVHTGTSERTEVYRAQCGKKCSSAPESRSARLPRCARCEIAATVRIDTPTGRGPVSLL